MIGLLLKVIKKNFKIRFCTTVRDCAQLGDLLFTFG